jgi:hypothetical protein
MSKKIKTVIDTTVTTVEKKGYRIKQYYLNLEMFKLSDISKCPNQVKIILDEMSKNFNKIESASQGKLIVDSAIANNSLKTVIDPAVLFAYYRKYMEQFGLTLK